MKGNNEDSFVYSGPISSASRTKIYVNFAHQTYNLCAIKNIIKACQKLQIVNKYTVGTFLNFFWMKILVCLLDLIPYVPVNTFSAMSEWFFMGWTSSKQVSMCLGQTHNAVMQMGVYQGAPWYPVKHCTTKPLCTLHEMLLAVLLLQLISKGWLSVTGKILTIMYM